MNLQAVHDSESDLTPWGTSGPQAAWPWRYSFLESLPRDRQALPGPWRARPPSLWMTTVEHARNPVSRKSPEGYLARSESVIVVLTQVAWKQTYYKYTCSSLCRRHGTLRPSHHFTGSLSRELVD